MAAKYVTLLINNEAMALEKHKIVTIEPHERGTRIILDSGDTGNLVEYITHENYDFVVESYNS